VNDWRLERYETLASTSDLCVARARTGEPEGLAVLAAAQTAGRGSRGRHWVAPAGNLNLSILLRPASPAAGAGIFALLAGLAVAEALQGFLPVAARATLKWPNDILLDGAKLGGILIDAAPVAEVLDWLVIGIGVNLETAPEIEGRPTTTLRAHGGHVAAGDAAAAVLDRMAGWLAILRDDGAAAVRAAWLARAHPLGVALAVRAGAETREGEFAGISATGALLLRRGGRVETINTGEVLLDRWVAA
jgi:BirA family biotin operon repressor/biotin-[acetyl-CoA-carboxylase] ligase